MLARSLSTRPFAPFSSVAPRPNLRPAVCLRSVKDAQSSIASTQEKQQDQVFNQGLRNAALFTAAGLMMASAAGFGPQEAMAAVVETSPAGVAAAKVLETVLRPLFTLYTLLYIIRIPMTWYPSGTIDGNALPWSLAYIPTEPFLAATRKVIPLVGGVDVTPIVWVCSISFFNEILLGPQGLLLLVQRSGSM